MRKTRRDILIKGNKEVSQQETYDLSPAFSRVSSSRLLDLLTVWRTWSTTSDPCRHSNSSCQVLESRAGLDIRFTHR